MRLIYIHQYFVTNEGTSATRSYDVSRYLVEMGHEVTMITGVHDQSSLPRMPWYRLFQTHHIDGIRVVACNAYYSNSLNVIWRTWSWLKFAMLATWAAIRVKKPDLIFATSTPPTVGIPGRIAAAIKGIRYIFEVRDLWPEDLLAAGRMKRGFQYWCWERLESFCYAKAAMILLVSKGFHDRLLERGFPPEKLRTLVLGADGSLYKDVKPDHEYWKRHGLDGKLKAVYTGAHGDANGLTQLLDVAEQLKHRPDIAIILIGEGKMRPLLIQAAKDRGLTNIHMHEPVQKMQIPGILAAADVGLMILKQITRPRWVTPNKIFDYMFAGLPSIVNFAGTTAELVEADGVGVAAKPGDAADLASRLLYWADHPEERKAIGRHAREVAFSKYDRVMIAKELESIFVEFSDGYSIERK